MAKIDTLFMTKAADKTIPFGAAHTYIARIRKYPPPLGANSPKGNTPTAIKNSHSLFSSPLQPDFSILGIFSLKNIYFNKATNST